MLLPPEAVRCAGKPCAAAAGAGSQERRWFLRRISPCLPGCCSPSVVQCGPCGRSPRTDPPTPSGGSVGQFANEAESVGQSPPSAMTEKAPPRTDPPTPLEGRWINETGSVGHFGVALFRSLSSTKTDPPIPFCSQTEWPTDSPERVRWVTSRWHFW